MRLCILLFLTLLLLPASLAVDISPKGIEQLKLRIIQSGSIEVTGSVSVMNLTVYVPQEGVESMDVYADSWQLISDEFGNDILLLEWDNPKGLIDYSVDIVVDSNAKHVYSKGAIGSDPFYLQETDTVVFNDEMRKLAYPYEKSLEKAAELTILVNQLVSYDDSLAGEKKPSDWVLANKRGVCAEFSNLLTSLLRLNSIPTSYVVGYSYSELDKQFIGHAWVEILTSDGWVALDPTWLEAGYLDATHVKIANLPDSNHTEILSYRGSGGVHWIQDEKEFEILDYREKNITSISLESDDFAGRHHFRRVPDSHDKGIFVHRRPRNKAV
jgi:transglutaminase-like putative cysteine protease